MHSRIIQISTEPISLKDFNEPSFYYYDPLVTKESYYVGNKDGITDREDFLKIFCEVFSLFVEPYDKNTNSAKLRPSHDRIKAYREWIQEVANKLLEFTCDHNRSVGYFTHFEFTRLLEEYRGSWFIVYNQTEGYSTLTGRLAEYLATSNSERIYFGSSVDYHC